MRYLTPEDAINTCYYVATDDDGYIYTLWHGLRVRATTTNAYIYKMRREDYLAVVELDDYLHYGLTKRLQRVS